MSIELMLSNLLIICHPFLLLPSIFPSIRVFSNELSLHIIWSKYWSFSISPSKEIPGLISFRMDWLDLLAYLGNHNWMKGMVIIVQLWPHRLQTPITVSQSLLKLMSIESVMPSNHLILCHLLLLLPSIFPGIRVFSNESALASGSQVLELQL